MHILTNPLLTIYILQNFMIRINDEFFPNQIMLPSLQSPYDRIEFFVISAPLLSCLTKLLIEIANWFALLRQNNSYTCDAPNLRVIHVISRSLLSFVIHKRKHFQGQSQLIHTAEIRQRHHEQTLYLQCMQTYFMGQLSRL